MTAITIRHANVITDRETLEDRTVVLEDGRISSIAPSTAAVKGTVIDGQGHWLMPGMIDLHSDAMEQQLAPRPNVRFPRNMAFATMDCIVATCGITTVYHGLSYIEMQRRSIAASNDVAELIVGLRSQALVRHELHLRCEVPQPDTIESVMALLATRRVGLVSVTDHTPGQGQFRDVAQYRRALRDVSGETDDTIEQSIAEASDPHTRRRAQRRAEELIAAANRHSVPVASHDDDTVEKVAWLGQRGVRISEFPVTFEAARAAKDLGLAVTMGAPNVVRGRSMAGNLSAIEAIRGGLVDALCSDYHPPSMLHATFRLAEQNILPLHRAVRLSTRGPARAVGRDGRGIAIGSVADLVLVARRFGVPVVRHVVVDGELRF
jgi:alpha-D-ribose 1-methylphosphonate 5-triphosphate diphosphatase